ncbi:MAG: hypothetical protein HYV27_10830 [Candidatus Hydrogenedentes bacterium]|nr:hypothetical protein [Candidatus Hydrogenedentota bacterium]
MNTKFLFCLAFLPFVLASAAHGQVWFVDSGSIANPQNGTSWSAAFSGIQAAIDAAFAAGGGEVWVKSGVYNEARDSATGALMLRPDVDVYGGFQGTEVLREADRVRLPTTINALSSRDGLPAYHAVIGADNLILEGFVVLGASANGADLLGYGGGMLIVDASPAVRYCTFLNNMALRGGGGMYILDGSPALSHCTFTGNMTTLVTDGLNGGGGLLIERGSPEVDDCRFIGNSTNVRGGGLRVNFAESQPLVTACLFDGNVATRVGGGAFNSNGARPVYERTMFRNNSAGNDGGGMSNGAGASIRLENCLYYRNYAGQRGGGLCNGGDSSAAIVNSTFAGNNSNFIAGAIFRGSNSTTSIVNSIVWANVPDATAAGAGDSSTVIEASFSIIQGGMEGNAILDTDPRFAGAAQGDYRPGYGSPALDAGTAIDAPDVDLEGRVRPMDGGIDLGAYEVSLEDIVRGVGCSVPGSGASMSSSAAGDFLAIASVVLLLAVSHFTSLRHGSPVRSGNRSGGGTNGY